MSKLRDFHCLRVLLELGGPPCLQASLSILTPDLDPSWLHMLSNTSKEQQASLE